MPADATPEAVRLSKLRMPLPQGMNGHEPAETEETDKLLLSSLRYWEVTRDLIEERIAALRR